MRKLIFVLCILISMDAWVQLPLPCTFYTNSNSVQFSNFSGYKETPCLTFDFWQGDFGLADDNFRFYSTEIGDIHENFNFDSSNGGELHISSGNIISNLAGAWIYPTENYIVPMYTKVEWGIVFPSDVQEAINNWIINSNTGLAFSPALNPFDPEQIDIWAEVTHNGVTERVNGFYYIPYERGDDPSIDPNYWDWIPQSNLYNFRIRYTPVEIAEHAVKIRAVVPGFGEFELPFFEFQSAWNTVKDGFIKVSPNNHYLAYDDGSLFFPVGMNLTSGSWGCTCDTGTESDDCETCYIDGTNDPCCGLDFPYRQNGYNGDDVQQLGTEVKELCLPLASYKKLDLVMNKYIESGANAFKFVLNPVYCDIEYERINNYYDRMHQAWELDKLINTAEQNDLKMQFNMQLQTTWQFNASGASKWDWSNTSDYQGDPVWEGNRGNCYWHDLGLDALNPYEFFTSVEARKQYKKKVRYIVARWGYTPNIYLWEIFSEINGVGSGDTFPYVDNPTEGIQGEFDGADTKGEGITLPKPYDTDYTTKRQIISDWTNEIFSYLTNDLGVRQLMTCSYTGLAPLGHPNSSIQALIQTACGCENYHEGLANREDRDRTWENPLCDAVCWSEYDHTLTRMESRARTHISNQEIFKWVDTYDELQKPLLLGENGVGDPVMGCDYTGYINDLLTYPFSGYASAGMSWDEQNTDDYWHWMGRVNSFLNNHFFNTTNVGQETWHPFHEFIEADGDGFEEAKVEAVYMMNGTEKTKLIGVVMNRTVGWWNQDSEEFPCGESVELDNPSCCLGQNFTQISSQAYNLKLKEMDENRRYKIMYFDPRDNTLIDTKWNYSNFAGNLNLEGFPSLTEEMPWFYIKVYHDPSIGNGGAFFQTELPETLHSEVLDLKLMNDKETSAFELYPNPTSSVLQLKCDFQMESIEIYNVIGQLVFSKFGGTNHIELNLNEFQNGVYYVIVPGTEIKQNFVICH